MKRLSFYLTFFVAVSVILPENMVADTIPDSTQIYGTWNMQGSPYLIMGLAIIPVDSTLTIDPGVQVKFKSSTYDSAFIIQYLDIGWIKAYGKLIAVGSESDSINFTSNGEGRWGGIHFENVSTNSQLKYCKIEKCNSIGDELIPGESYAGGLTFNNSEGTIENSDLSHNHTGVYAHNSNITLIQNKVTHNNDGIGFFQSFGKISSCLINDNYDNGIRSHTSAVIIENNTIERQLKGIHSYESNDTIRENLINNNLWGGIEINQCNPFVFRNVIHGSNSGIRCNGNPRIANNTIINNNYYGIYCDWEAKPVLINNIIYGNGDLINYDSDDLVVFANNLLQVDALPAGLTDAGGNIFNEDPMFIDPSIMNFSLDVGSPCINAGINYFELDGEILLELNPSQYTGIAPDIGAIESTYVGVEENFSWAQGQNKVLVYPNPAKGYFIIRYELDNYYADAVIQMSDISGRIVKQFNTTLTRDYFVVPTHDLSKGNYLVKLILNDKEVGSQKLIIQ